MSKRIVANTMCEIKIIKTTNRLLLNGYSFKKIKLTKSTRVINIFVIVMEKNKLSNWFHNINISTWRNN